MATRRLCQLLKNSRARMRWFEPRRWAWLWPFCRSMTTPRPTHESESCFALRWGIPGRWCEQRRSGKLTVLLIGKISYRFWRRLPNLIPSNFQGRRTTEAMGTSFTRSDLMPDECCATFRTINLAGHEDYDRSTAQLL